MTRFVTPREEGAYLASLRNSFPALKFCPVTKVLSTETWERFTTQNKRDTVLLIATRTSQTARILDVLYEETLATSVRNTHPAVCMPVVVCLFMDEYAFFPTLDINIVAMRKHWMPEATDKRCIVCHTEDLDRSTTCKNCGVRTCQECVPGMGKMVIEQQQIITVPQRISVPCIACRVGSAAIAYRQT